MAHAVLTLSKSQLSGVSNSVSWVENNDNNRPVVPATLMAGSDAGKISSFTIVSSSSRAGTVTFNLTLAASAQLSSTMEVGGTVEIRYGDANTRFRLSSGGGGQTVFGDTSNPYAWLLTRGTEQDLHSRARWVLEAVEGERIAGTFNHDLEITLWDGVGTDPFPADPVVTYEVEQTFTAPSDTWNTNSVRYAVIPHTPRPAFEDAFKPDDDGKFLEQLVMRRDRQGIILFISGSATAARTNTPEEPLSSDFLERGEIELTVAGNTVTVPMSGPDVFDPRNTNQEPDTTEFYRIDLRGLSAIRYERWVQSFVASNQSWQGVFKIRAAETPIERQGARKGAAKLTGAYRGTKPLRIYRGSKLVYDFRPSA